MYYRKITKETASDLHLPNESFEIYGEMKVSRMNNKWSYEIEKFDQVETMKFPNEYYQFEDIQEKGFAIGAYQDNQCVGLAIYAYNWNKYLYLHDLKVKREFRKQGVASELIEAGQKAAKNLDYQGLYTIAQDNNLAACQFYLKTGFEIGGLNTHDYHHTPQKDKADIYFYLD